MTPSAQLLEQTARLHSLSDTLARLKVILKAIQVLTYIVTVVVNSSSFWQDEVAEHIVTQQRGARASSDFATFPSTLFVKVNATKSVFTLSKSLNISPRCQRNETESWHLLRRPRRRSRRTRCWWAGSWCRVLVVRSRSTASSCRSVSCRGFTVCCGAKTLPTLKGTTTLRHPFCSLASLRCGSFHFNILRTSLKMPALPAGGRWHL